jgi:hypothetical protein
MKFSVQSVKIHTIASQQILIHYNPLENKNSIASVVVIVCAISFHLLPPPRPIVALD